MVRLRCGFLVWFSGIWQCLQFSVRFVDFSFCLDLVSVFLSVLWIIFYHRVSLFLFFIDFVLCSNYRSSSFQIFRLSFPVTYFHLNFG